MANSENNDDLTNRINTWTKEDIENILEEKQLKSQWREEINANTAAIAYLKSKGEYAIEGFISYYINKKYVWYTHNKFSKNDKTIEEEWLEKCQDHLSTILQKKIVDLQCLWNANLVKVPEVETSDDFNCAFGDPFNCTFIEPITLEEIKMYQDFLLQDDIILDDLNTDGFIFYDKLKKNHVTPNVDEEERSEWYDYHYERTGTINLLDLPTIRSDKEHFYSKLAQQEIEAKKKSVAPAPTPIIPSDDRPFINYYDFEIIQSFVTQFETPDYQRKHKYYTIESKAESRLDYGIRYYFDQMIAQQEYIPMKANADFIAAIEQSYNDYCIGKIVEALPQAHEAYLYKTKHGLHEKEKRNPFLNMIEEDKKMILEGRVLNGEPRDFNF
ncbi:MAG: hypothetical protein H7239_02795 [Flavobacterium sp.]|nr:hypothetical protein [Flavobacterium sp.]